MMAMCAILLMTCPISIVFGVAHAKWLELINPNLKYEERNNEIEFWNLECTKTRNIINDYV